MDPKRAQLIREQQKKRAAQMMARAKQQPVVKRPPARLDPVVYVKPDVQPENYNNECYIVGGGPSLIGFNWKRLDGKFVIGINRAYEVLPAAQIIYFTDLDYWHAHKKGMLEHKGLKMRGRIGKKPEIKEVTEFQLLGQLGWSDKYGELYHGSNSGYACMQLAAQLGFKKIYLLGFDMKHTGTYKRGKTEPFGVTHWHSGHKRIDPPAVYPVMLKCYSKANDHLKPRGLEVINVNKPELTSLKDFPIKTIEEVFGQAP